MYCRNRGLDDAMQRLMLPATSLAHHGPRGPASMAGGFGSYPRGRSSQRPWVMAALAKPMTDTTANKGTRSFLGDPLPHVIL